MGQLSSQKLQTDADLTVLGIRGLQIAIGRHYDRVFVDATRYINSQCILFRLACVDKNSLVEPSRLVLLCLEAGERFLDVLYERVCARFISSDGKKQQRSATTYVGTYSFFTMCLLTELIRDAAVSGVGKYPHAKRISQAQPRHRQWRNRSNKTTGNPLRNKLSFERARHGPCN